MEFCKEHLLHGEYLQVYREFSSIPTAMADFHISQGKLYTNHNLQLIGNE